VNAPVKKSSLAARFAAAMVRLYQLTLSPALHAFFGPGCGCRFHPNCSCYAREAFFKHGFIVGCRLTIYRILRCHPWSSGGYDPVPGLKSSSKQDIAAPYKSNLDG